MTMLFISHSPEDRAFVRELRAKLELHGVSSWMESRELAPGQPRWPEIQKAIEDAFGYAVVVSADSLQSEQIGDELAHALAVQERRGHATFPVIPLLLDGTKLGVLKRLFGEDPASIPVSSTAGGADAAMDGLLAALGKRLPSDTAPARQPTAEALEELVLELTDCRFVELDGARRASGRARLVYRPATPGLREVVSLQDWRLVAPFGPVEADELRWYLEKFAIWPSEYFRGRASKVEKSLERWGQLLHGAALPVAHTANVMQAWARIDAHAGRRFSVHVDAALEAGASDPEAAVAREAATALLGLPWELLHDGGGYLFQGARPTRVRRRLPNTRVFDLPVADPPIRVLLVTARPEDEACGYIDHRSSALPLIEAMEALPGLVRIHVLSPPTLSALREELDRAHREREPYHVIHFDGHGAYDRRAGLGGLCFEDPRDADRLEGRRHALVYTRELGPLLRDHRVPLVFLEACHTATAEQAAQSVASALLEAGVASVVAMTHGVLVETTRRFVEAFYGALARGARVGDAMLAGQRALKDDTSRGRFLGAGELRLEDWFVPVLFQERDDPQLFREIPSRQTRDDFATRLKARLGELPPEPSTGFVGRSRDLLALQRLLRRARYAVVRGQGGEGKTALAAELARWMVRSHQVYRAAFVSVETHSHAAVVLDAIGRQLVPGYSVATFSDLEQALLPVERALREHSTVLVVDNMESILLPPFMAADTPEVLAEDAQREIAAILELCARLTTAGDTRLVFTSREALPAPFDAPRHRIELHRLGRDEAVRLVERTLNADANGGHAGTFGGTAREEIEQLVDAVHGHARTLALLAPPLRSRGVEATRASLVELMEEMERSFPGSRERSVFASVELSLRRLSPVNRERVPALAAFHGGVDPIILCVMMEWEEPDVTALVDELVETGLATREAYDHLALNPALCVYLRGRMDPREREALMTRWNEAMWGYLVYLMEQRPHDRERTATLTLLERPNLFALLDQVQREGKAEVTITLATTLNQLLDGLGRPRWVEHVAKVRDTAAAVLSTEWGPTHFQAEMARIEQDLGSGRVAEAFERAHQLLEKAEAAGASAYSDADYDLAMARVLLSRTLHSARPDLALALLDEALAQFATIHRNSPDRGAKDVKHTCLVDRGNCLLELGRLEEAAESYGEAILLSEKASDEHGVALGKYQLGTVRLEQGRYAEALEAYLEARDWFTSAHALDMVAGCWHQIGRAHQESRRPECAEDAFRNALKIWVQVGNVSRQAGTLGELGTLYLGPLNLPDQAEIFFRQAADKFVRLRDHANEGMARSNLAQTLVRLRRFDEARREIRIAIECDARSSQNAEPWKTWAILAKIEIEAGNFAAAAEARRKAIAAYLVYRRSGGENNFPDGQLALVVAQLLLAGDRASAAVFMKSAASAPEATLVRPYIDALQAIVTGVRSRKLAETPSLYYRMAAEILFLIETLEAQQ